ncbi:MAG: hypothetical protein NT027_08430 [Proteobacteria bacterium]|nr:hypothetical protein [Pseudomonadota bacterium]
MDYLDIQANFVMAIRGSRSQRNLNKLLKMTPHRIHRLEKKKSFLKWTEFVSMCEYRNIDICNLVRSTLELPLTSMSHIHLIDIFEMSYPNFPSLKTLNEISRFKIYRWQKGLCEPKFTDILRIIDSESNRFEEFSKKLMEYAAIK